MASAADVACRFGELREIHIDMPCKSDRGWKGAPIDDFWRRTMATVTKHDSDMPQQKQCYSFTLTLGGFEEITPAIEQAVFEAGCDDALLGIHCGTPYLAFDRDADSLEEAIKSAIKAVESIQLPNVEIEIVKVIPAGEETIGTYNAYLTLRRIWLSGGSLPEDTRNRLKDVLHALLEHNPETLKQLLSQNKSP